MLYMYYRELRPHSPPKKGYRPPIPILVAPNFIVLSLALPTAGTYLALSISSRPRIRQLKESLTVTALFSLKVPE